MRRDQRPPAAPHPLQGAIVERAAVARLVDVPHRNPAVLAVDHPEAVPQSAGYPGAPLALAPLIFPQIAVEALVGAPCVVGDAPCEVAPLRRIVHSTQRALISRGAHLD